MTSAVRTITLTVPNDVADRMDGAVKRGEFTSAAELIAAALDQWSSHEEPSLERLRELYREGVESGPGSFGSIEEIKAEARRRLGSL